MAHCLRDAECKHSPHLYNRRKIDALHRNNRWTTNPWRTAKRRPRLASGADPSSILGWRSEDQRGVGPAEAEGVRERVLDLPFARLVRNEVEVRLYVRVIEVQRGRGDLIAHGEHGEDGL